MIPGRLADALPRARRSLTSGRLLWREGQVADAYGHAASGLTALVAAWADAGADALENAGYSRLASLSEAVRRTAHLPAPRDDEAYGPAHARAFEEAWAEAERLCAFTERFLRTPAERRRRRLRGAAALAAAVGAVACVWIRIRAQPLVTASAVYSSDAPAAYAVDGLDATEWLLPDHSTGWLELAFRSPRAVRHVRLRNAHNRGYLDRGARAFRVIAFAGGAQVAATAEGSFEPVGAEAPERELPLAADGVTRLRVDVLSYYGLGGGLAEVTVGGP